MTAVAKTTSKQHDRDEIVRFATILMDGESVIELRALDATVGTDRWPATYSGYFNDPDKLVAAVLTIKTAKGIYATMNPCNPALLARGKNRIRKAPKGESTADTDIVRRRWLLIDADAKRPSGISASDDEHQAALDRVRDVYRYLKEQGFPDPIAADSGNGGHLNYRVDLPADDGGLIQRCLEALAARFNDDRVTIDTGVFNPARIWKLYGTTAAKGDDTDERPHRLARILNLPDALEVVPQELLEALADEALKPEQSKHETNGRYASNGRFGEFNLEEFIARHLDVDEPSPWKGDGRCWTFRTCPMCEHGGDGPHIVQHGSGAISAGCHHDHCSWTWADLRERFEPKSKRKRKPKRRAAASTQTTPSRGDFRLTDAGNAKRLVAQHGQDFRYCYPWSKHLSWDGKRWRLDDTGAIERAAKDTARSLYGDAANEPDADRRMILAKFAANTERVERLSAMSRVARSEPGIPVLPDQLDADPWSLNTPNGTVNLKTGELRPHRRDDLLTKITAAEYLSAAESDCPIWEETLDGIFQGKTELIRFVKMLIGYSLIGEVQEHILPVLWGNGSNGKSLFIETVLHVLGKDYASTIVSDLLLVSQHDQHPTERADLFGKRLVACVETDDNRKLSESAVKVLTGGDTIKARRMREDFWEFQPSHTVLLVTNHKPVVQGTDHGIWRRLRLIPFTTKFWDPDKGETGPPELEADKKLGEKLKVESAGILRWCVDGCLDWQRHGLVDPPEVRAATADYRRDMDVIGAFIDQCCLVGNGALRVKGKSLYAAYRQWAESSGERLVSQRQFGLSMTDRDIERIKSHGATWYVGIALRADDVD